METSSEHPTGERFVPSRAGELFAASSRLSRLDIRFIVRSFLWFLPPGAWWGRGPAKSADEVKQAPSRERQDWTLRDHRADRPSDDWTLQAPRDNGVHKQRGNA